MKSAGSPPIRTERLFLRKPEMQDVQPLVSIGSLKMTLREAEKAVAGMLQECAMPFCYHWVITLNGQVIGRIKAWDVDPYNGRLQLGYDVGKAHQGRGYMTEAVGAVVQFLFTQADVHRVFCSVREGNLASCRVCEKCGMKLEGVLRQHYARQDGGFDDVRIYGIVRADQSERTAE